MKELRKKIIAVLNESLSTYGFKRKGYDTFVRMKGDNLIQSIGFLSGAHGGKHVLFMEPVIGVTYKDVDDLHLRLHGVKRGLPQYVGAQIGDNIANLIPNDTVAYREWEFHKDEDVVKEANNMADYIIKYGLPYLDELSDENQLIYNLDVGKHRNLIARELVPIFYHLRGDNARALAYIEEAIDSIRRRFDREYQSDCETITMLGGDAADIPSENRDLAEYMRFVEAFRRMLETGRVEP